MSFGLWSCALFTMVFAISEWPLIKAEMAKRHSTIRRLDQMSPLWASKEKRLNEASEQERKNLTLKFYSDSSLNKNSNNNNPFRLNRLDFKQLCGQTIGRYKHALTRYLNRSKSQPRWLLKLRSYCCRLQCDCDQIWKTFATLAYS